MGYQITVEIPDGDWCLKMTEPYILCPLLVTDGNDYFCPFDHREELTPLNQLLGSTIERGGTTERRTVMNIEQELEECFEKTGFDAIEVYLNPNGTWTCVFMTGPEGKPKKTINEAIHSAIVEGF